MTRATLLHRSAMALAVVLTPALAVSAGSGAAFAQAKPAAAPKIKLSKDFLPAAIEFQKQFAATKARPDVVAKAAELKAADDALNAATTRSAQKAAQANLDAVIASMMALLKPDTDRLAATVAKAVTNDDKFQAGAFSLDVGLFASDKGLQRQGLEMQLASGFVPREKVALYHSFVGKMAYGMKDYMGARTAFQAAIDGGHNDDDTVRLLSETYFGQNDGPGGLAVLKTASEAAKAAGRVFSPAALQRGVSVSSDIMNAPMAGYFGAELVKASPSADSWRNALYAVRRAGRYDRTVSLDLIRLMDRVNGYGDAADYLEYIQTGTTLGLPREVLRAIDKGVAAGKLTAADLSVSDARNQANARLKTDTGQNLLGGYERDAGAPSASVKTITGAADTFLSYGDPAKAEKFYTLALTKPGVDSGEVLTRLGIAQYDQGKFADAQATFAKVTGPRAPLAQLWAAQAWLKASGK